jgi:hypothetical protein
MSLGFSGAPLFFCANHLQELFELVLLSRQRTHLFCQILLVVANLLRNILARLVHQEAVMHPFHGCLKPQSDQQTNRDREQVHHEVFDRTDWAMRRVNFHARLLMTRLVTPAF